MKGYEPDDTEFVYQAFEMEKTEIYTFDKIEEADLHIRDNEFEECDNYINFVRSKYQ